MTPRQRVVKYLVQITHNKTVEGQLRQQWLEELAQIRANGPETPIQQKKQAKAHNVAKKQRFSA